VDIRCDLLKDLDHIAESKLISKGYRFEKNSNISIFNQYMNLINREVSPQPRSIFYSKHLKCPEGLKNGFQNLIHNLKAGYNVNAYLSSSLKDASYNDGFLNDFGLHHFHLGSGYCDKGKSKGFINRTGPVLIAYITDFSAYLIGIFDHGMWFDQKLIEIVHDEWPHVLKYFKINGVIPEYNKITTQHRKILRDKRYNAFLNMPDGTVYTSVGGGITGANTNTNLTIQFDFLYDELKVILNSLCIYININGGLIKYPVKLKLLSIESGFVFKDKSNDCFYILRKVNGTNISLIKVPSVSLCGFSYMVNQFKLNAISQCI
jgi:hypothetical protein